MNYLSLSSKLILWLFFVPNLLFSQVFQGDLTLRYQTQVDTFDYQEVTGKLTIESSGVTDLTPMLGLKRVGDLKIYNTRSLESLDGLDSLHTIETELLISRNDLLKEIDALAQLESVKDVEIFSNEDLEQIDGLIGLQGSIRNLAVKANWNLLNMNGLLGLTRIEDEVLIFSNKKLPDLDGLKHIRSCHIFSLVSCDLITQLDSLDKLTVSGEITINGNHSLNKVSGFLATNSLNKLQIIGNLGLSSLAGLQNLTSVKQIMLSSTSLSNLNDLGNISGKVESITLLRMDQVTDIQALGGISEINDLTIDGLGRLTSLQGLEHIQRFDHVLIEQTSLRDFTGLEGLTEVTELLHITGNPQLTSLKGMESLSRIGRINIYTSLKIINNNALIDLDGLYGLRGEHTGGIQIMRNDQLESIMGLDSLSMVYGKISIYKNPKLKLCCSILPWIQIEISDREVKLFENLSPCNKTNNTPPYGICVRDTIPMDTTHHVDTTVIIVDFAMDTTVTQISTIFPNPTRSDAFIYFVNPNKEEMKLEFFDISGRNIHVSVYLPENSAYGKYAFQLPVLASGIYYYRLANTSKKEIHKLVIW